MKKQIRILSGVCACTMLLTGFAGCKKEDPSKTLYIDIGNAGYGIEWLNPLKETFEAEHEGYIVKISSITKGDNEYLDKAISGTAETDIFFVETTVSSRFDTPITANGVAVVLTASINANNSSVVFGNLPHSAFQSLLFTRIPCILVTQGIV